MITRGSSQLVQHCQNFHNIIFIRYSLVNEQYSHTNYMMTLLSTV